MRPTRVAASIAATVPEQWTIRLAASGLPLTEPGDEVVPVCPPPGLRFLGCTGEITWRRRRHPVLVSVAQPTGHRCAVHVASHARTSFCSCKRHSPPRSRIQDTPSVMSRLCTVASSRLPVWSAGTQPLQLLAAPGVKFQSLRVTAGGQTQLQSINRMCGAN